MGAMRPLKRARAVSSREEALRGRLAQEESVARTKREKREEQAARAAARIERHFARPSCLSTKPRSMP
jgi:hypothetical protein